MARKRLDVPLTFLIALLCAGATLTLAPAVLAGEAPAAPPAKPPEEKPAEPAPDQPAEPPAEEPAPPPAEEPAKPPAEPPAEPAPERATVPDLSGKTQSQAAAALLVAGLKLGAVTKIPGKGDPGKILGQDPAAGAKVEKGSAVAVQMGAVADPVMVPVPALVGLRLEDAKARLAQAGLKPGAVTSKVAAGKGGEVLSQDPAAGASVKEGTPVRLVVGEEPPPEPVAVPDLGGVSLVEASRTLQALGLAVGEILYKTDNTLPPGRVITQSPKAGTMLNPGAKVNVTIARKGEITYAVPDVLGKTAAQAEKILRDAGFIPGKTSAQEAPEGTPEGIVLKQTPDAGAQVKERGAVDMVLSRKAGQKANVPGLVGLPREGAEALLKESGLVLGTVTAEYREGEQPGMVLRQTPEAGAEVEPGSAVDLLVAGEPADLVRVPIVLRMSLEEAQAALQRAGLKLGTVEKGKKFMKEIVVKQLPYPFRKVPRGTAVTLTVTER